MSKTRRPKLVRTAFIYLLSVFLPPLIIILGVSASDIVEVAQTGLCPGFPPDGGPYPCSVLDYMFQVLFGPFALVLTVGMTMAWGLATTMAFAIYFVMKPLLTPPTNRPSSHLPS
ncbi:MAG: hypothetical protein ACJAYU_002173 [Bradymonadia bacterium]|jgi:hypothetical protein